MAETNSSIILPSPLFTDPRSLKALANGTVYVGKIDTDPTQPANQIPVYNRNEDGSLVQVAQPISISVGGYPVLNGIPFSPIVKGKYSIAIFDTIGVQRFYFPYVSAYQPTSASLAALAELSPSADKLPYFNGTDTAALTALTDVGREIIGKATIDDVLTYLNLGDLVNALFKTNNLSDLPDKAVSRTNLGVPAGVDKQMCTAWASWSNNGTVCTIKDSFNVSSVTFVQTGTCTVNFSTAMANANYSAIYGIENTGGRTVVGGSTFNKATGSIGTGSWGGSGVGSGIDLRRFDAADNNIQIFGGR